MIYLKGRQFFIVHFLGCDENSIKRNAHVARSGKAQGVPVYANYGTVDDFKTLKQHVDITGKICLVRYGIIFRWVHTCVSQSKCILCFAIIFIGTLIHPAEVPFHIRTTVKFTYTTLPQGNIGLNYHYKINNLYDTLDLPSINIIIYIYIYIS